MRTLGEMEKLNKVDDTLIHIGHRHSLNLTDVPGGDTAPPYCHACRFPCTGSIYQCAPCRYILHRRAPGSPAPSATRRTRSTTSASGSRRREIAATPGPSAVIRARSTCTPPARRCRQRPSRQRTGTGTGSRSHTRIPWARSISARCAARATARRGGSTLAGSAASAGTSAASCRTCR